MKKNCYKYDTIIIVLCTCLFSLCLTHRDNELIVSWARDLLQCIFDGNLKNYPEYTYWEIGMATNYSLLANSINAILLLPCFLLEKLLHCAWATMIYQIYYKVIVIFITLAEIYLLKKIFMLLDFKETEDAVFLFGTSSILQLAVISKGQTDLISLFLIELAIYYLLKEKYAPFLLLGGCAIVIKPFAILLLFPIVLLLREKWSIGKSIMSMLLVMLPYLINELITLMIMPEYNHFKKMTDIKYKEFTGISRIEEIFRVNTGTTLIFLSVVVIICFICWYIAENRKVKQEYYALFPALMFLSYGVFVSVSIYWYIILLPFLVYMSLELKKSKRYANWLMFVINMATMVQIIVSETNFMPHIKGTIVSLFVEGTDTNYIWQYIQNYASYISQTALTLFLIAMIIICGLFTYENIIGVEKIEEENETGKSEIIRYIQIIPLAMYLILSILIFLR